jgi:hypothetical protein
VFSVRGGEGGFAPEVCVLSPIKPCRRGGATAADDDEEATGEADGAETEDREAPHTKIVPCPTRASRSSVSGRS